MSNEGKEKRKKKPFKPTFQMELDLMKNYRTDSCSSRERNQWYMDAPFNNYSPTKPNIVCQANKQYREILQILSIFCIFVLISYTVFDAIRY